MNKNLNISLLIDRCKLGQTEAQYEIYKLFYKSMYNTAFRILNQKEDAEDAMQDCFIKAFDTIFTLKDANSFGAWLKQLVIRHCLNKIRKEKKWKVKFFDDEFDIIDSTVLIETDLCFYDEVLKQKLQTTILKLKSTYRVALSLHYIEGLDSEEMCDVLDITNGNCRTLLSRAKKSLKEKLLQNEK